MFNCCREKNILGISYFPLTEALSEISGADVSALGISTNLKWKEAEGTGDV